MNITLKSEFSKAEIDKLSKEIKKKQAEIKLLQKAIEHYMNLCDHKGMYRGTDRGGGPDGYCSKCGYSY